MSFDVLSEQEIVDKLAGSEDVIIALHVWFTQFRNGRFAPDPVGQLGVDTVVRLAKKLSGRVYILVAGGHPYMSGGQTLAAIYGKELRMEVYSKLPDRHNILVILQDEAVMAASSAGEMFFFRYGQQRLQIQEDVEQAPTVIVCASAQADQVRTLAKANRLQGDVSLVTYPAPPSRWYFLMNKLLLILDRRGRIMEFIARQMGSLKQTIARKVQG